MVAVGLAAAVLKSVLPAAYCLY